MADPVQQGKEQRFTQTVVKGGHSCKTGLWKLNHKYCPIFIKFAEISTVNVDFKNTLSCPPLAERISGVNHLLSLLQMINNVLTVQPSTKLGIDHL